MEIQKVNRSKKSKGIMKLLSVRQTLDDVMIFIKLDTDRKFFNHTYIDSLKSLDDIGLTEGRVKEFLHYVLEPCSDFLTSIGKIDSIDTLISIKPYARRKLFTVYMFGINAPTILC